MHWRRHGMQTICRHHYDAPSCIRRRLQGIDCCSRNLKPTIGRQNGCSTIARTMRTVGSESSACDRSCMGRPCGRREARKHRPSATSERLAKCAERFSGGDLSGAIEVATHMLKALFVPEKSCRSRRAPTMPWSMSCSPICKVR